MFDLLVTGGRVVDGSGPAPYLADVGVTAGRIAAVGALPAASATTVVDATGRLVLPGLIDAHSHADGALAGPLADDTALAALRQGVTTLICGQDGLSYAPASATAVSFVSRYFAAINGPAFAGGPLRVVDLLAAWDGRTAINAALLVPHGTIRFSVLGGLARAAEPGELTAMRALVEEGLADGAVGLSSGLEYVPGRFADAAELAALCAPVAAARLPYVTHMRGYGLKAPTGLAEARTIAVSAGVGLHVSHYAGPGDRLASMMDDARAGGADVTFDSYPYRRSNTILAMAALPARLADPDLDRVAATVVAQRSRVRAELDADLWPRITLAHVPAPAYAWTEGLTLTDAATRAGVDPGHLLLDLVVATGCTASVVIEAPASTTEESIRRLAGHEAHMGGSDGIVIGGHPHPRAWGAFASYLGRFVRERGEWSWADAVEHLAVRPARRFGLTDRGRVAVGLAADLAVVDPTRVADEATYDQPRRLAVGVDDVIVNGVPVIRGGALTGARAGRALRPYPGGVA